MASTIFGFITTSVIGGLIYSREATAGAGNYVRAVQLAEEGVDAARNIRDADYSNLSDGTYGLAQASNRWVFSGSADTSDIFQRQVTISTVDNTRKTIGSTVTWSQGNISRTSTVTTRLTDWRTPTTAPVSWSNAVLDDSDTLGNNKGIKIATQGNYAYVVMQSGNPEFYVVDIRNVSSPRVVGTANIASNPRNIVVEGNYAYIASTSNNSELQILDISNPVSPVVVENYNAPGNANAYGIRKAGNYVYLSLLNNRRGGEFLIINVSNPNSASLTGSFGLGQNMRDICVLGDYTYVGTDSNIGEISVVRINPAALPTLVRLIDLPGNGNVTALRCYNNKVFVAHDDTLRAINVSNPLTPTITSSLALSGSPTINDIAAKEDQDLLFLATNRSNGEFEVIDVANSAAMNSIRQVDIPGSGSNLQGVAYNPMHNIVAGASESNSQEFVLFRPD